MATPKHAQATQPGKLVVKPRANAADLPYELWLNIFESLTHEHTLARPELVKDFVQETAEGQPEEKAVSRLFEFEKRAWKVTRPYYAINRKIRMVAQQLSLSAMLLQSCQPPIRVGPAEFLKDPNEPVFTLSETELSATVLQLSDDCCLHPTYLALDVYSPLALQGLQESMLDLIQPPLGPSLTPQEHSTVVFRPSV